jgi:hypothetical protein
MTSHSLFLHEEIVLLALHDEKGTVPFGTMVGYAVGGALIAELLLRERLALAPGKRADLLTVRSTTPVGEPALDLALEQIRTAKRRASATSWVGRLASRVPTRQIALRLAQRGIVRREEGRFLLIFTRDVFPTVNPDPERELVERMRRAIFEDREVDGRTAILVGLAKSVDLLRLVFDRKAVKARKQRLDELAKMHAAAGATREAIESVQAAMVAVTAASAAAAASSGAG